jgi:hypothetical protein
LISLTVLDVFFSLVCRSILFLLDFLFRVLETFRFLPWLQCVFLFSSLVFLFLFDLVLYQRRTWEYGIHIFFTGNSRSFAGRKKEYLCVWIQLNFGFVSIPPYIFWRVWNFLWDDSSEFFSFLRWIPRWISSSCLRFSRPLKQSSLRFSPADSLPLSLFYFLIRFPFDVQADILLHLFLQSFLLWFGIWCLVRLSWIHSWLLIRAHKCILLRLLVSSVDSVISFATVYSNTNLISSFLVQ